MKQVGPKKGKLIPSNLAQMQSEYYCYILLINAMAIVNYFLYAEYIQ